MDFVLGKSWSDQDKAGHENISQSRNSQLSSDDLNSELQLGQYQKSKPSPGNAEDVVPVRLSR